LDQNGKGVIKSPFIDGYFSNPDLPEMHKYMLSFIKNISKKGKITALTFCGVK
jgi:hypothetical protein